MNHLENKQQKKVWGHKFPDFKTHHKAAVIKIMWYLHEDRHRDKWNRIENSNINLYIYGHFYFWQEYQDKLIEIIAVITNGAGTTRYSQAKEWSWTPISRHIQKKKKKPLEGNTGINVHDLALGNEFLDKICKAQMAKKKKKKSDKLNFTRILKFEGPWSGLNSVLQKFKSTGNLRIWPYLAMECVQT